MKKGFSLKNKNHTSDDKDFNAFQSFARKLQNEN